MMSAEDSNEDLGHIGEQERRQPAEDQPPPLVRAALVTLCSKPRVTGDPLDLSCEFDMSLDEMQGELDDICKGLNTKLNEELEYKSTEEPDHHEMLTEGSLEHRLKESIDAGGVYIRGPLGQRLRREQLANGSQSAEEYKGWDSDVERQAFRTRWAETKFAEIQRGKTWSKS